MLKKLCSTHLLLCALFASSVYADEAYSPVSQPITPGVIDAVPAVEDVPGKDFSDALDMTYVPSPHAIQPSQLGMFDGLGGARNGLLLSDFLPALDGLNVDAQSQVRDTLFPEVVANRVPLVVSTNFDEMLSGDVALAAERATGAVEAFATSTQIVNHPHVGGQLRDIDSVDLWGPEADVHAGFYSFADDPDGVAVYAHTTLAVGGISPYLSSNDIATAIGNPGLSDLIDIDAVMVNDVGTGFNPFDGDFGRGDSILFSITPIPNPNGGPDLFDGGEVWVWNHGQPAQFLEHGGHVWDTTFDVQSTFGVFTENIDALEAVSVPEPTALFMMSWAVGGALCVRQQKPRRRRRTT